MSNEIIKDNNKSELTDKLNTPPSPYQGVLVRGE